MVAAKSIATELVERRPAIGVEFDELEKSIEELRASIDFTDDRVGRLENRIHSVLGPDLPANVAETFPRGGERPLTSPLAEAVAAKTSAVRHLAELVRSIGQRADVLADRVEL